MQVARSIFNCTTFATNPTFSDSVEFAELGQEMLQELECIIAPLHNGLQNGTRTVAVSRRGQAIKAHFLANIWRAVRNLLKLPGDACNRFIDMDGIRVLISYLTYDVSSDWRVRVQTAAAQTMDTLCHQQPELNHMIVEAGGLTAGNTVQHVVKFSPKL